MENLWKLQGMQFKVIKLTIIFAISLAHWGFDWYGICLDCLGLQHNYRKSETGKPLLDPKRVDPIMGPYLGDKSWNRLNMKMKHSWVNSEGVVKASSLLSWVISASLETQFRIFFTFSTLVGFHFYSFPCTHTLRQHLNCLTLRTVFTAELLGLSMFLLDRTISSLLSADPLSGQVRLSHKQGARQEYNFVMWGLGYLTLSIITDT